ncbi:hypothetical protein GTY86_00715, partial [Streptomyces sp. SID5770]|uniref:protease inhibitor I9 family protein n=1 Tax=Streptomyces sp. SID5770 TaxID=2690308 RepID=UPI00137E9EFB
EESDLDGVAKEYAKAGQVRQYQGLSSFSGKLGMEQLGDLQKDRRVKSIEQDQIGHLDAEQVTFAWGLDRIDQRNMSLD